MIFSIDRQTEFFCPRKARKTRKICRVAVSTDEPAPAKFLCAKVGFTFLVGGDMERRRLAGMKLVSLSHHRKLKMFKNF